ncbi:MAG: sigma-54-dependent Fis family transcriptional regulator [Opitutales bacterium]|nr:sigma-54-dependent Fis family transcriptional regulator [Opitutales bacterium]
MPFEKILILDDEPIVCRTLQSQLRRKRYNVATSNTLAEAERILAADHFDMLFMDLRLPDGDGTELLEKLSHQQDSPFIVVMTGYATVESAVNCMRLGAFDYIIKPFSNSQIEITIRKAEQYHHILNVARFFAKEDVSDTEIIGDSPAIGKVKELIARVARTQATVLIQGESGTGKELIANEIHKQSNRAGAPFIRVNCAAISETLIESEFFGHEKGAFTGATARREGRFELADGGTILLDEISEISLGLQAKLLRVLQENQFERVGGNTTLQVDVRVLATTNRNLVKSVERGDFREDLYYRLNVFPIHNPALRERREDIPLLARAFVDKAGRKHGVKVKGLSTASMECLLGHDWPGNVRELQNMIERAVIMTGNDRLIEPLALGLSNQESQPDAAPTVHSASHGTLILSDEIVPLEEIERACILNALRVCGGNRTHAAKALGIALRTLRNKIRDYRDSGVDVPESADGGGE